MYVSRGTYEEEDNEQQALKVEQGRLRARAMTLAFLSQLTISSFSKVQSAHTILSTLDKLQWNVSMGGGFFLFAGGER